MRDPHIPSPFFGLLFLAAGTGIMGMGLGVIPVDPATVHAPMWVLAVCGLVFVLGGVAVVGARWSRVREAAGIGIVLAMGLIGGWVALFGDSDGFSGGVPFVSPEANVVIARVVFGLGAGMCLALFVWGASRVLRGGE